MLKKLFKEEGFDKPIKVIESCVNLKQLESAKNYVKLFRDRNNIISFLDVLDLHLFIKKMKLKNGGKSKS